MLQNQSTAESAKSMPCIDMPTILVPSDHSLSFKSFNSAPTDNQENDKSTERHTTVKALIDKFRSLQGNSVNYGMSDSDINKKPFIATIREKLETSNDECINMEGNALQKDDVKNTVRCHLDLVTILKNIPYI